MLVREAAVNTLNQELKLDVLKRCFQVRLGHVAQGLVHRFLADVVKVTDHPTCVHLVEAG